LVRLADPLHEHAWPQRTHLAWRQPVTRLAAGDDFEIAVVDALDAPLPDQVFLHVRHDGDDTPQRIAMQYAPAEEAFVYRLEDVRRPFHYRATGGDDQSLKEVALQVVEPPEPVDLRLTLHYPPYTGWPAERCETSFRALAGTRVELAGSATKPLRAATIEWAGHSLPLALDAERWRYSLPADGPEPFLVEASGAWRLLLEDREGVVGGRSTDYDVRLVEDAPPSVSLDEPTGNAFVTPEAVVPLTASAKDDLGLRSIVLLIQRGNDGQPSERLPLWAGPDEAPPPPEGFTAANPPGASFTAERDWELTDLGLKPGDQLTIQAEASDYVPQTGLSPPRRLSVISRADLEQHLAERQDGVLNELARLLQLQEQVRGQVGSVQIQVRDVGQLVATDVDQLQSAEMQQRQVQRGLVGATEGVPAQVAGLLADLRNNRVDDPDLERQMEQVLEELARLDRDVLPGVDQALTAAIKDAQRASEDAGGEPVPAPAELPARLDVAAAGQDEVAATLERLLGDLAQGAELGRVYRDLAQVREDQQGLSHDTDAANRETVGRDWDDLTPQEQADLAKLADRQRDLARRFDRAAEQMGRMRESLAGTDPLAADAVADALDQAGRQALSGQMSDAARDVEQNNLGQAGQAQQQIGEQLQDLLDTLANRRETELGRLVTKLKEAEQELAALRERQGALRQKMADAEKLTNEEERRRALERLAREERELQAEAERLARRLERLQAEEAGRSLSRAGESLGQAGQAGEAGDAGTAGEAAGQAERDLEQAQQEVARRRRQAEMDLAIEQLARLEDALRGLSDRQQGLIDELLRLAALRAETGRLSRSQAASVQDLSRAQAGLQAETAEMAEKLASVQVFSLALRGVERQMKRAAELLAELDTGEAPQTAQRNALRRIGQLLAALAAEEGGDQPQQPEEGEQEGGDQGEQGQPPGDGIPELAQLKLLRLLQTELNERTAALEESLDRQAELSPAQREEYAALAEEQGQLAEMLLNLSQPDEPATEDERMPELFPEDDPAPEPEETGLELDSIDGAGTPGDDTIP
jgi:hypothetical protein